MKKIITLALFGLLQQSQAQGLLTNLEACYPMDCNELNYAPTGSAMNGGASNLLCTSGHTGASNTAYEFQGIPSSYFYVPGNAQTKSTTDITVSGWYYPTITGTQYLVYTQAGGCTSNWEAYYLALVTSGSNVIFRTGKSDNTSGCGTQALSSAPVPLNNWYHVVFHISPTIIELTVNGTAVTPLPHASPLNYASGTNVYLGGSNTASTYFPYTGKMDDVRFYNRTLTSIEIEELYNGNVTCSTGTYTPPSDSTSCCLGNYCTASPNALTGNYQVPLNNYNFNFSTPKGAKSQVLIGFPGCTNTVARLDVFDDNNGIGIKGYSTTRSQNNIGVYGLAFDPTGSNPLHTSVGVLGEVNKAEKNRAAGVAGFGGGPALLGAIPVGIDIGVYGNAPGNSGGFAGYFDGDVYINGGGSIATPWFVYSDKRFKNNIKTLESVSEKLKKLSGYTYTFKTDEFKDRNFTKKEQIGFIAQELKELFPQLVQEDSKGFLSVNYEGMVPVLVQAFKEQQKQIDELKALVQTQAAGTANATAVSLSDKNVVVLNQNVPNPFAESTVISYNIPDGFGRAQIIFSTTGGTVIKTVDIKEKGAGSLNIFANDLSHGLYSYSLVIDGKTVDTKKMIKE